VSAEPTPPASCPRCGARLTESQEYCVECGLRLPVLGRFGPPPDSPRRIALPLLLTLGIAAAGAVAAIALTREAHSAPPAIVATGGSIPVARAAAPGALAPWPAGKDGWSIVLLSIPKSQGQAAARALAHEARQRGLPRVGILDSNRYASLHPGYWIVFTGVYETEADANGALLGAREVSKAARTQRISG
jgi:hypothetical protein